MLKYEEWMLKEWGEEEIFSILYELEQEAREQEAEQMLTEESQDLKEIFG